MNTRFPIRLVSTTAIVSSLALIAILFASSRATNSIVTRHELTRELTELRGRILLRDETLTMSARLAAATGDEDWIRRYQMAEPMLVSDIEKAIELADSVPVERAAKATEDANFALIDMELRSFELVREGRAAAAAALLSSSEYAHQKRVYGSGMQAVLDQIQRIDRVASEARARLVVVITALGVVAVLLLLVAWTAVLLRLRRWQREFEHERASREVAEAAVKALNDDLEQKVDERTKALANSEALLTRQANVDGLTGLATRSRGMEILAAQLESARKSGERVLVASVDIDGFRSINESFGHPVGDRLLIETAQRLLDRAGPGTEVTRLGGDEFLLTRPLLTTEAAGGTTSDIRAAFARPFQYRERGAELTVTPSIGVSIAPEHGDEPRQLLRNADLAMYLAKKDCHGGVFYYDRTIETTRARRRQIERGLRRALDDDLFRLHYQPKVVLANRQLGGAEALLRWNDPTLGFVPPDQFVPIAEESGFIVELGAWVVDEAARQVAAWQIDGHFEVSVAINVSPLQLHQGGFLDTSQAALDRHELAPTALQVELTETSLLRNDAGTQRVIDGIAEIGCELALDDFGTGYSSLSYLKQYPFDYLKIDRAFVAGMLESDRDAAVIDAILALARSLDLRVIAEGTESIEQCDALRTLGCDMAQGYYYSKPLPAEEFVHYVNDRNEGARHAA